MKPVHLAEPIFIYEFSQTQRLHLTYLLENRSNKLIKMGDIVSKPLMLIVIPGLQDDTGLTQKHFIILKIVSVSSNKYRGSKSNFVVDAVIIFVIQLQK